MAIDNYFKVTVYGEKPAISGGYKPRTVTEVFFFFDTSSPMQVEILKLAERAVAKSGGKLSVWRTPRVTLPKTCGIVGVCPWEEGVNAPGGSDNEE